MSVEKLREELKDAIENRGLKSMGFSWADGAEKLTPDERAAAVLEWMAEAKRWDALPVEAKMREQIKQSYEHLSKVIDFCKTDLRAITDENMKEAINRSKVFGGIEQAMLLLGNWIDNDTKNAIRNTRPKKEEV
jgi:sugar phosphate isomerase/epimerase